jgi:hypothetical protein
MAIITNPSRAAAQDFKVNPGMAWKENMETVAKRQVKGGVRQFASKTRPQARPLRKNGLPHGHGSNHLPQKLPAKA